ncbi:MAG: sce7726 family protein [Coriobacteriia bacterium]|nr:sce7726 family protein [Coriobacteriia bacterium]
MRRVKDALTALFAGEHLDRLAWCGPTPQITVAQELLADRLAPLPTVTVADVFDEAFRTLVREHPVEYVFKSCALERLLFGRHSPRRTAFYTEFRVGDSRADLVVINGQAHAYEVKTSYDDFSRLAAQLEDYYRVFTHVTLFVDETRAESVARVVPEFTGIVVLSRKYSMSTVRPAVSSAKGLDNGALFRLLHSDEYLSLLSRLGVEMRCVDRALRYGQSLEAFAELDPVDAQIEVMQILKQRQRTTQLADIADGLPHSLRLAPFAYRKSKSDWGALSERVLLRV